MTNTRPHMFRNGLGNQNRAGQGRGRKMQKQVLARCLASPLLLPLISPLISTLASHLALPLAVFAPKGLPDDVWHGTLKKDPARILAGSVCFFRERRSHKLRVALNGSSAVCYLVFIAGRTALVVTELPGNRILGSGCGFIGARCARIWHVFKGALGCGIGRLGNGLAGNRGFCAILRAVVGAQKSHRVGAVRLRHGNGGCGTRDQKETCDGKGDFAAFILCHGFVSLVVNPVCSRKSFFSLLLGRLLSFGPALSGERLMDIASLVSKLNLQWAGKRVRLCNFWGNVTPIWSQLAQCLAKPRRESPDFYDLKNFMNASFGNQMRRVAPMDGLVYERRNFTFDGDTAR